MDILNIRPRRVMNAVIYWMLQAPIWTFGIPLRVIVTDPHQDRDSIMDWIWLFLLALDVIFVTYALFEYLTR